MSPDDNEDIVVMKVETIRFVARDDEEAYFYRTMHQLTSGCLMLGAKDDALTAVLEVMARAVGERRRKEGRASKS